MPAYIPNDVHVRKTAANPHLVASTLLTVINLLLSEAIRSLKKEIFQYAYFII